MNRVLSIILVISLSIFYTIPTWGAVGCGARAAGMGGAFTAVADDGSAPYWNPAGIQQIKFLTFTPTFGVEGKYEEADVFTDPEGNKIPFGEANYNLASLSYIGFTSKYVALNGFVDLNASYNSDLTKLEATQYGENYGYGTLTVAGSLTDQQLMMGVNLKVVQGVLTDAFVSDITGGGYTRTADGSGMACDIGVLYWLTSKVKLGLMARNVYSKMDWTNSEEVTYSGGGETTGTWNNPPKNVTKANVVGIAYNPYESLTLAVDVEMIDDTLNNDLDQTRYHIGLEQTALWDSVALRLGAFTDKQQTGFTGGLGFKLGPVLLDVAAVSSETNIGAYLTGGLKF